MLALIESIDLMEICKILHALPCVFVWGGVCVNLHHRLCLQIYLPVKIQSKCASCGFVMSTATSLLCSYSMPDLH